MRGRLFRSAGCCPKRAVAESSRRAPLGITAAHGRSRDVSRRLQEWLFPAGAVSPPRTGRNKALTTAGYVAAWVALAGLALLRQSGLPAWKTIWAEDGKFFYSQALSLPFARTLVTLHAGYVQLYPRLVAALATAFAPRDASWVMALAGAASLAAISCLVFHMARGHVASPLLRGLLAGSMVFLPVAGAELLDNAVNVPWWLFFACFWAFLWRPPTRAGSAGALLLCALAGASEPLTALLLPLAALRVACLWDETRRRPWEQAPVAGLLAGLAFQAVVIIANTGNRGVSAAFTPGNGAGLAQSLAFRVGLGLLAGVKGTDWLVVHQKTLAVALGVLVLVAVATAGAACPSRRARSFTAIAVFFALVCFLIPAWLRDVAPLMAAGKVQPASRYQAVPLLLLVSALVVTADGWAGGWSRAPASGAIGDVGAPAEERNAVTNAGADGRPNRLPAGRAVAGRAVAGLHAAPRRRRRRPAPPVTPGLRTLTAAVACVLLLAPTWVVDFRDSNSRSRGPSWPVEIARASHRCASSGIKTATVPTDPTGWEARVPCRRLLS